MRFITLWEKHAECEERLCEDYFWKPDIGHANGKLLLWSHFSLSRHGLIIMWTPQSGSIGSISMKDGGSEIMQSDESGCLLTDQQYGECIEIKMHRSRSFPGLSTALFMLSVLNTVAGRHKSSKLHLFVWIAYPFHRTAWITGPLDLGLSEGVNGLNTWRGGCQEGELSLNTVVFPLFLILAFEKEHRANVSGLCLNFIFNSIIHLALFQILFKI